MAKTIIPMFPKHHCYCEVFCGSAQIFFQKSRSSVEVLNDKNGELVNFFRVLRDSPQVFIDKGLAVPYSRDLFNEYVAQDVSSLSAEDRAWRFFYINRCSFSGLRMHETQKPSFSASPQRSKSKRLRQARESAFHFADRLLDVCVENLGYDECIALYDSPQTFFYIDPPYVDHEEDYGKGLFSKQDFKTLAKLLAKIKGRFLLSINNTPLSRKVFKQYNMQSIDATYSTSDANYNVKTKELIFTNYEVKKTKRGLFT